MKFSTADAIPMTCNYAKIEGLQCDPETFMSALKLRFKRTFWMECKDLYEDGGKSIVIAAKPIAGIEVANAESGTTFKMGKKTNFSFGSTKDLRKYIDEWIADMRPQASDECKYNGLLGYCSYNSVQLSENIIFTKYDVSDETEVPLLRFSLYRYIFVFKKSIGEILLINNCEDEEENEIDVMTDWLKVNKVDKPAEFSVQASVESDCTDIEFMDKVEQAKMHCRKGDIFQVVLSRKFSRDYYGDPWTFFLTLKKDVSSYQFFIDEYDFQIAGTSPEIHFQAVNGEGCINPIAGTYRRSDSEEQEKKLEAQLLSDPKENSEHVMLVDLARNDLNKIATKVHVSQFKKIEKYTHVMHIVSRVKGTLPNSFAPFQSILDVFPAGTLSGAPKYKAMQIIDTLENSSRSFYGGLAGWIGFNKDINTCIIIRSALFANQKVTYRAGAGIVESSLPELELEEVKNKLKSISCALSKFQFTVVR